MIDIEKEATYKICCACGRVLPLELFRLRKRGGTARQGCCRECYNAYMRARRKASRSKVLSHFASQLRKAESLSPMLGLVTGMTARFGGVNGLCKAWAKHIESAKPGSRAFSSSMLAIVNMAELLETARQSSNPAFMTDTELDQELTELLSRGLQLPIAINE
jgi:hypothetical protein